MKKSIFILLSGLTLLFSSCKKETELLPGGPATFQIASTSETVFEKLPKNGSQEITFAAITGDTGVREQLTASFKMGGSDFVAKYNQTSEIKALEFPAGACTFIKNDVTIDRYNKSSRSARISVSNTPDMLKDAYYVLPVLLTGVKGSENAFADTTNVVYYLFKALGLDKGQGTKDKPYLIYELDDFKMIKQQTAEHPSSDWSTVEVAAAAVPTYFKMMADIDLSGIDWEPVNFDNSYCKKIDFNGNGKTISNLTCSINKSSSFNYFSLFGVLWGDAYNFTVENAVIEGNSAIGVICGYAGTGTKRGNIKNVKVKNSSVLGTGGNAKGAAIIAGRLVGGEVGVCSAMNCTVDVTCNFPGGIVGYTNADGSYVHDCYYNGSVKGAERIGGIVGMLAKTDDKVENCIFIGTLNASRNIGGIVGHANFDKWDERHVNEQVIGCLSWAKEMTVTNMGEDAATTAAIIGFTSQYNTGSNCWRSPSIVLNLLPTGFAEGENNPGGRYNTLYDQNDFSDSSPLDVHVNSGSKILRAPYHGKVATVSASALAQKIGWDENIWDLSADIPVLK